MNRDRILRVFAGYIFGEISLEQFEEWIVSHLQETLDSKDQHAIALIDEADSSLIELNQNHISEEEFMTRIASMVAEAETVKTNLTSDIPLSSTESNLSESVYRMANFTGLSQVRISLEFESG
jgi:hypothetical protein